ncbi:MAG: hypothetical protein IPG50_34850 [Myxococcales bacterium]|nr:hypothetical protein [Myxococcales bacterium]
MSLSSLRLSASLFFSAAAALIALAGPVATTACSGGVCSADEEKKCNDAHGSCTTACGDGTKVDPATGLPSPDPNYSGCVSSCNSKLCSCLDSCGSTCNK